MKIIIKGDSGGYGPSYIFYESTLIIDTIKEKISYKRTNSDKHDYSFNIKWDIATTRGNKGFSSDPDIAYSLMNLFFDIDEAVEDLKQSFTKVSGCDANMFEITILNFDSVIYSYTSSFSLRKSGAVKLSGLIESIWPKKFPKPEWL